MLLLLLMLSLMSNGCKYQSHTQIGGSDLMTPYGTAKNINAERDASVEVK